MRKNLIIYQSKSGKIEFRGDFRQDTIWANLNQIADLFGRDKSVISRHIKNIFKSGELDKKSTVAKIATVQKEGNKEVLRNIEYFNLDVIISVGYRVDSKRATQFRIWATKVLKQHLVEGYTINKKRLAANYQKFMRAIGDVKALLPAGGKFKAQDALELINAFAATWFSLESYDKESLPKSGATRKQVLFTAEELQQVLRELRQELISKKQATDIFGRERSRDSVEGIVGNVFQSFAKKDLYPTVEEKAAHLLYFIVKNHPFVDGNKRSGAFAFIWFLRKAGLLRASLTPEALTALTLLVAESSPKEKDKIVGLVVLLLKK
jgi:death-on-curing family protein